mgnify:CR=1 FL=1
MSNAAAQPQRLDLDRLVDDMLASYRQDARTAHIDATFLPRQQRVIDLLERLRQLLFPGFFGEVKLTEANLRDYVADRLADVRDALEEQIDHALRYAANLDRDGGGDACEECTAKARRITNDFLGNVPELRRLLALDVQAAFDGDPACRHTDEAVFCYPGVFAVFVHRVAHELFRAGVPLLPRLMNEHAHSRTGIDLHPGATVGESFFIDHGTGVVIGETAVIGDRVKLYQSVTIGAPAAQLSQAARGAKRHPTIEDDVVVYANATILGGETVIGRGSIIGGGVFLTSSVPDNHFVYNKAQELKYRSADRIRELTQTKKQQNPA